MTEFHPVLNHHFRNWSKTYECFPEKFFLPKNVEELRDIILLAKESNRKVKVVGKGHSPNDICCTKYWMLSLKNFDRVLDINKETCKVKVECGIELTKLNSILRANNLSLPIQGSVSDISLGGAISVATHGSSINHNVISGYVTSLEIISSYGDVFCCSVEENGEIFNAALCGLGATGIIVNVTLQCEKKFLLHQIGYPISIIDFIDNMHEFMDSDYIKVNWYPYTGRALVINSFKVTDVNPTQFNMLDRVYNWILYKALGHYTFEFCLWLSSFFLKMTPYINRFFFTFVHSQFQEKILHSDDAMKMDCLFSQHVNEWAIPIEKCGLVLLSLDELFRNRNDIFAHFPIEIRFAKRDKIYLSPAFGRDTCFINVIVYRPFGKEIPYQRFWTAFEYIMKNNEGRPHWAKAHNETGISLRRMYPKFLTWVQIRKRMDPISMFTNEYIDKILLATS